MPKSDGARSERPAGSWSSGATDRSLSEVWGSVPVSGSRWSKALAFLGPGYLVSVGYMVPGNWATSLAAGSKFGYELLAVVLVSSLMAVLLQALSARLGFAAGRDLAQACRDAFPRPVAWGLWLLAEIAICATDLAEVIGTAIGLNLVFGIPLEVGVLVTACDVLLILYLQNLGFRWIEAFVVAMLTVIAGCFAVQVALAGPSLAAVMGGFRPHVSLISDSDRLYLAMGILGATVMPHNLYLHTSIVQTRSVAQSETARREAIGYAVLDSTIALTLALLVNAAILILAAATFHVAGRNDVSELGEAYRLLAPMVGSGLAATLFGVALICCGLNSTVTATLAGQVVMEGFLRIKLPPWARRLITRLLAIVPAIVAIVLWGEHGTAKLLILSQVVLSLQLPFAIIPLVMFTADRGKLGPLVAPRWMSVLAALIAVLIVVLNLKLVIDALAG